MLDLRIWLGDSIYYANRIVEADAVYTANGYGLCTDYLDAFHCSDEFVESLDLTVLFVSYNRNILYTSIVEGVTSKAFSEITRVKV